MKIFTDSKNTKFLLLLIATMVSGLSYGAIFTATTSGSYSSSTTWAGGTAPSATVTLDQIIIPAGLTVSLDNPVTLNGALAQLTVNGNVTTANNSSLTLGLGTLAGSGSIIVSTVNINPGAIFSFTGSVTATTMNVATTVSSAADIMVDQTLYLTSGALTLTAGGSLDVANNANIVLSVGSFSTTGGTIGLTGNYNVSYINVSAIAGAELTGSGLKNVTVNVTAANTVTLAADLTIGGTLALTTGTLALGGNDLSINGEVAASGTGTIASTAISNISINTTGGTTGTLTFTGLTPGVNNFTINIGAGNQTRIAGTLNIAGTLQLNSGTLNFSNTDLTISGGLSGAGLLSGDMTSDLTVSTVGGLATALNFANGGQMLHDFNVSVGIASSVSLGSNVTVSGALALSGNLNLNGNALALGNTSTLSGTGAFMSNSSSDLIVNSTVGLPALIVTGPMHNLTINTASSDVVLAGPVTIAGMLSLQSGELVLGSNNLVLSGTIANSGSGTLSSTAASDISVTSTTSPGGALNFTSSANTVGTFNVNIGGNGNVVIGSDLNVNDTLRFVAGKLNVGANSLMMGALSTIEGANSASYVVTSAGGYLQRAVAVNANDSVNFPIGTDMFFAPANIQLNAGSSAGQIQVGVMNNVFNDGNTGSDISASQAVVDATWDVHSLISGTLDLNLEVLWSAAMEVNGFNRNMAYVSHYVNGNWDVNTTTAATTEAGGMYSLHKDGLTSLSPFSVFDQTTTTGIANVKEDVTISVYPNPATENIIIQRANGSTENLSLEIYNITGQLVSTHQVSGTTSTIAVDGLKNGSYFMKLYNGTTSSTKSFIKM